MIGWALVLLFLTAVLVATVLGAQSAPTFPFTGSTINNTRPNTIPLKFSGWREEATSSFSGTFFPGSLLMQQSDGTLIPHNVFGGGHEKRLAFEDALQGHSIIDGYANTDLVFYGIPRAGDRALLLLAPGGVATEGTALISNGDGQVVSSPGGPGIQLYQNVADSTALASSATETKFNKSFVIPANFLQAGDVIKVRGLVDGIGVTATPTFRTKLLLVDSAAVTVTVMDTSTVSVIASDLVEFEATIVIRTVGASGTLVAEGFWLAGTPGAVDPKAFTLTSTAIDTTKTQEVEVTGKWSASSSSNTALLRILNVELQREMKTVAFAEETIDNSLGTTFRFVTARFP